MSAKRRSIIAGESGDYLQSFGHKHPAEDIKVSVDFSGLLPDGITVTSALAGVSIYQYSDIADDGASGMIDGSCVVNDAQYQTPDGNLIPANCGVIQTLQLGVHEAVYVVTFVATLSEGGPLIEQVILPVFSYADAPNSVQRELGVGDGTVIGDGTGNIIGA